MMASGPGRLAASRKFLTEEAPHLIQHLVDQVWARPGSCRVALMLRGPVQRKRERNEPSRAIGQASPKEAEDCPNANRDGDRLHRILRKVVAEFCGRGDE